MRTTEIRENLKKSLARLDRKTALADEADKYYEENPFDADAEKAFEHAYENQYNEFIFASHLVVDLIGCDEKTARAMIRRNRDKLIAIL